MTHTQYAIQLPAGSFYPSTPHAFTSAKATIPCAPGEWIAIQGPSGLGKTTLLRYLTRALDPKHTTAPLVPPRPLTLFQGTRPALLPWCSAANNITLCDRLTGQTSCDHTRDHLLSLMQMQDFAHTRPHALSSGMAQRIALAQIFYTALRTRALHPDVPLILGLDEPFSHMDPDTKHHVILGLQQLSTFFTVIFITHSETEAQYAQHVYRLHASNQHMRTFVGED